MLYQAIIKVWSTYLKSNMDRFIVIFEFTPDTVFCDLKSNMDRFIVFAISDRQGVNCNLKSNMDRFIGAKRKRDYIINRLFKIQYG